MDSGGWIQWAWNETFIRSGAREGSCATCTLKARRPARLLRSVGGSRLPVIIIDVRVGKGEGGAFEKSSRAEQWECVARGASPPRPLARINTVTMPFPRIYKAIGWQRELRDVIRLVLGIIEKRHNWDISWSRKKGPEEGRRQRTFFANSQVASAP